MHLLIVEDYRDNARLFSIMLRSLGAVDTAASVDEALEKTGQTQYDLLLVDIQLGENRTGIDLLHALREDPRYAETPMIACTADVEPEHRSRILKQGFDGFIGKPFTKEQLLNEVKHHLAGQGAPTLATA